MIRLALALAAVCVAMARPRDSADAGRRRSPPTFRTSSRRRRPPASTTPTIGPWEFFVGGGVAAFDCDGDRRPDLFMAGGAGPAALYRNRSATGRPAAVREGRPRPSRRGPDTGARRLSARHRQRRLHGPRRPPPRQQPPPQGRAGLHLRGRQPRLRLRRRQGLDDGVRGDLGGEPALPDAGLRQLCRPPCAGRAVGHLRRQRAAAPGARRRPGLRRSDPRSRPASARCRCSSPTGTSRARRRCG